MSEFKKRKRYQDYVIGLLTGRVESITIGTLEGPKLVSIFKPSIVNPHSPLAIIRKERKGQYSEDQIQVFEGLRHRRMFINYDIFKKNNAEKKALKKAKKEHKSTLIKAGFNPKLRLNLNEPQILR